MFDIPPKCPALSNKLTGIFGWRHTYNVSAKHEGIQHTYLQKSYSLTLPKRPISPFILEKEPSSWVSVHHLSTQSGILDPDDCIRDVADDREEILASFEDSGPDPGVPQGGGDGASGSSSVGTGSPDIFRDPTNTDKPTNAGTHADHSTPHIEITSTTMCPVNGLGLQVRRSSDPNMLATLKAEMGNKRWSAAAPHCAGDSPERIPLDKSGGNLTPQWEEEDDLGMQQQQQQQHHQQQQHTLNAPAQQHFVRSVRSSMQFLGDGSGHKWLDAVEKLQNQQQHQHAAHYQYQHQNHQQLQQHQHSQQQSQSQSQQHSLYTTKSLPRESKRKEPLGQAYESMREKAGEMLLIINEQGSRLGFTALPDNEHGGGLLVQFVEPGSRADRGRLRVGDRILEINGTKLIGLTESKIQEQLRRSLDSSELRVRVIRAEQKDGKMRRKDSKVAEMIEAEEKVASGVESKIATVSPTRKPQTAPIGTSLQIANTRKLGRKIEISLKKGPKGLGFSVTTRDNPAGGQCPIYIKNIMGYGAAIEDGRLKPGDRLLEIDGVPITGKTQSEVVAILRATQPGATVHLVVSRQHDLNDSDEREQNAQQEKENDLNSPPKPPAPVLPVSMQKQQEQNTKSVKKSSSARSIHEQQKHLQQQQQLQQQQNTNEFMDIFDAGSESAASSDSLKAGIAWNSREILTLHIPVHDTEKAGLGVSVKGKTNSNNNHSNSSGSGSSIKHDGDLGIFIKSVFHGGAASRDGRLRMNDQLLSVNGVSLLGQNNAEAMDTLRRAMVNNPGKHPGMITLSVARKITRSASSSDILEKTNDSSNTSENSGATVIYLTPEKKDARNSNNCDATNDMNRWSNPVLDRLTGGVCSSNSSQHSRRPSRDNLLDAAALSSKHPTSMVGQMHAGLRNDSYYMATHDTWSPAMPQASLIHGAHINNNNSVLIEDDPEPMSPTLPHRLNDSTISMPNSSANNSTATGVNGAAASFDATYSSQLSLETNNSGVDYFNRDATIRQSMSEKHAGKKDAQKTDTYQRRQKVREEIERERRKQLTKSAVYGGSVESLSVRIAQANAQVPGYKHAKTASGIETQTMQAEASDKVGDLGPSLGLKKSSSLESLQTMVQEIQMSDEPRGRPTTLRAPRGRGREEGLREAVVNDTGKPWLFEDGRPVDADGGFANRGVFQSSLNDGKHKSRAKKPGILRGIGHMFRFGKNRKDTVMPTESRPTRQAASNITPSNAAVVHNEHNERAPINVPHNQIPAAALAAMERNTKLSPPAYQQPPPPMPSQNNSNGIHANDTFNQRYPHYSNYDEPTALPHQISDENNPNHANNDELSESTLECMRQQVLMQRIKCVEAESRRHQHYHSQRSARSQDINLHVGHHHNLSNNLSGSPSNGVIRPSSSYYEYETVSAAMQQHRSGSIKQNGHTPSPITINAHQHQQHQQQQQHTPQPHWKIATMNGYSPSSLNSSARSRGPFITQVNIGNSSSPNSMAVQQQPTYQTVQRQQPQYANNVSTNASKV